MSASTSDNCKDGTSKSSDDLSDAIGYLRLLNIKDNKAVGNVCANCGKEGDNDMNTCNKCNMVKYCNAVCKKVHKKKHKKDCEEHIRLAIEKHDEELRIAAELHDEKLFEEKPPSQHGDCPICFLRIPNLNTGWKYQTCCGKIICSGCSYAPVYDDRGNVLDNPCPYCRTPFPTSDEEAIERDKALVEAGNAIAIYNLGNFYRDGRNGYRQDCGKALELWHRAADLGHAMAYSNIGYAHHYGRGVKVDMKKAVHYYELSAMMGNERARYNLGCVERDAGNMDRALKHLMIAVGGGFNLSLERIKELYIDGTVTKECYTKALQSYQEYLGEIKSPQRDEAAAFDSEEYRYY